MAGSWLGTSLLLWGQENNPIVGFKSFSFESRTSREAQEAVLQGIPWERLAPWARAKIEQVVSQVTLFRRMPIQLIQCDPEFFLFCVHHPEVVVNIWKVLGVSRMTLQPTPQGTYQVDDGMGTRCEMQFLFQSAELHVIYAEGSYEGPLLKQKVHGRGLLILSSPVRRQEEGKSWIVCQLDTFLQMEPGALAVLTKTLHPLMGRVSDYNFKQTARFVEELWLCGQKNPRQLERLAARLEISPQLRAQFLRLVQQSGSQTPSTDFLHEIRLTENTAPAVRQ